MNNVQRVIKVIATVFAVFLAVTIIGGILAGIFFAFNIGEHVDRRTNSEYYDERDSDFMRNYETQDYYNQTFDNINNIKIDDAINTIYFNSGDKLEVTMENVSTKCTVTQNNDTLEIKDRTRYGHSFLSWFEDILDGNGFQRGGTITITVPSNITLSNCNIDTGVGSITLDDLNTKKLFLDAGTGSVDGRNINAGYVDLDAGTGSIDLQNVNFDGLDIDAGTGSISITGRLTSETDIDCGTGSVYLGLDDPEDSYRLKLEKGLGSITVNGTSSSSVNTNPAGAPNYLSIEGGVGSINIDFAAQS